MTPQCQTCQYWKRQEKKSVYGDCSNAYSGTQISMANYKCKEFEGKERNETA